jgi:glycosyltransferase involved in cell wall biosynthesis
MTSSSQRPLLSIVIPTRERARYLRHSLNTAVACADPRIEIVVSDNASEDDTAKVVAEAGCANLKYVRTKERVPVSQNFESAFSNATGEYIVYLGDDDAVIPSGIRDLLELLETRAPDIVSWPELPYYWPDGGINGYLGLKRRMLRGGVVELDPAEGMREVCAGEAGKVAVNYGCISRKVVQTVDSRAGKLYYDSNPDSSVVAILACASSCVYLNRPVRVYGRSPASATTALAKLEPKTYAAFAAENFGTDSGTLDFTCRSSLALCLAGLR